jgi:hypothetical protein
MHRVVPQKFRPRFTDNIALGIIVGAIAGLIALAARSVTLRILKKAKPENTSSSGGAIASELQVGAGDG